MNDKIFDYLAGDKHYIYTTLQKLLNTAWNNKKDKSKNEIELFGITFALRKNSNNLIFWATSKKNIFKIAESLNLSFKDRFYVYTNRSDQNFKHLIGPKKILQSRINTILDTTWEQQKDKSTNTLIIEGLTFYKEKRKWKTTMLDIYPLAEFLDTEYYEFELFHLNKDHEIEITRLSDLFKYLVGRPDTLAKKLNGILDAAWLAKEDKAMNILNIGGIQFFKRLKGNQPAWAMKFTIKNIIKLAKLLDADHKIITGIKDFHALKKLIETPN
jgi:hypothetical protein